ncbi:MAG: hypothetical protein WC764_04620 [Candidatus Paceibacterota bacterium]|jgi:hypothetical protein
MALAKFNKDRLDKLIRAADLISASRVTTPGSVAPVATLLLGRALSRFDTSDIEETMIEYIDEVDKRAAAAIARKKKRRKAKE